MILNIYNFRDEREGSYGTPIFTELNGEQVSNQYQKSVETMQANVQRYKDFAPEKAAELLLQSSQLKDCVIYHAGTFDSKSGVITSIDPVLVCRLSDFFREVPNNA